MKLQRLKKSEELAAQFGHDLELALLPDILALSIFANGIALTLGGARGGGDLSFSCLIGQVEFL